ncbi:hypothetical protein NKI00_05130 [Mesorhizobium sp. M0847]|nr:MULTISPECIES: hypothetical protein [unclassified Mesorhizobium]
MVGLDRKNRFRFATAQSPFGEGCSRDTGCAPTATRPIWSLSAALPSCGWTVSSR